MLSGQNNWVSLILINGMLLIVGMGWAIGADVKQLENYQVFPINSEFAIEPSGLTILDGRLYTVCDDARQIFQINEISDHTAEAVVYKDLDPTQLAALNLDMEGITVVDGEFFLVSENNTKLVRLSNDTLNWVPDLGGVYADAYKSGLFKKYNAGLESVAYLGDHTFLLSVEREPRGLIEVKFDDQFKTMISQRNQVFDDSAHPLELSRKPDLTGLFFHAGTIYALHRNAYVIHELIKDANGIYQEGQAWNYEHIVKNPDYAYEDMQFGHAEGLAVDDKYFYLVLDNNRNPRLNDPTDIRPLLIKAVRE